jgi:hypothetical protein
MSAKLSLDTLGDLDNGCVRLMIDKAIDKVIMDLEDRGEEDGETREVSIKLKMKVKQKLVIINVDAAAKVPPTKSGGTVAKTLMRSGGEIGLFFQSSNPDNPDQPTMFDEGDGAAGKD